MNLTNKEAKKHHIQNMIDETIEESFPASDPPAWTVSKKHDKKPEKCEQEINLAWERNTLDFDYENYNRDAKLTFSGGESLQLSNPPEYLGDARFANAEELLIGALSFCYMHTYLAIASKQGYQIKRYQDKAQGILGKNAEGQMGIIKIHLNPQVEFEGKIPDAAQAERLQNSAHKHCFIANSLNTNIVINILINC